MSKPKSYWPFTEAMPGEYVRARVGEKVSPVLTSGYFNIWLCQTRKNVKMAKNFSRILDASY
jgi:hypothetical protein